MYGCKTLKSILLSTKKKCLPDGELNPSLLRDRRVFQPLDYKGLDIGYTLTKAEIIPLHLKSIL